MVKKLQSTQNSKIFWRKIDKIIKVAKIVRSQFEKEFGKIYPTLKGCCGLASYRIYRMSRYNGLYPSVVHGHYNGILHSWIEYYGYIIDITATQFGEREKIFVCNKKFTSKYLPFDKSSSPKDVEKILYWCLDYISPTFYKKCRIKL